MNLVYRMRSTITVCNIGWSRRLLLILQRIHNNSSLIYEKGKNIHFCPIKNETFRFETIPNSWFADKHNEYSDSID